MRARHSYGITLSLLHTEESLRAAISNIFDMLRLNRSDNIGVRYLMPGYYLRLRDINAKQQCYDFIKWWLTCDPDGHYNWADMSLPYLNIHNADMLEPIVPDVVQKYNNLCESTGIALIQMRLLIELTYLKSK
jgi:hypothetical protein